MKEYFGIDVGGTAVKWAVLGEDFSIRERGSLPTDFATADEAVEALTGLIEPYRDRVSAVGVSAPGGIYEDDADGTIHRGGALTYMDGCPLGKLLRERFDMPVAVNNDGKCCALGEYAAGALRGCRTGVVLAIGTGIGGGIVIDGRVLRGAHGFAGEFSFLRNDVRQPASGTECFRAQAAGVRCAISSWPRRTYLPMARWTAAAFLSGSRPAIRRRSARLTAMRARSMPCS